MECKNFMVCSECSKTFTSIDILIQHIKYLHPFLQSYVCKQSNCHRTFPILNSFKKHLIKNHSQSEMPQQSDTEKHIKLSKFSNSLEYHNINQDASNESHNNSFDNETYDIFQLIENAIVSFISKLYSNSSLPRNIIQIIIEETKELFTSVIISIERELKKQNVVAHVFDTICAIFKKIDNIFEKLETEYKRLKFLQNNFFHR